MRVKISALQHYISITSVIRILRQKMKILLTIFVNSALILHIFVSRFFHIKVFSLGSFDVACGRCRH